LLTLPVLREHVCREASWRQAFLCEVTYVLSCDQEVEGQRGLLVSNSCLRSIAIEADAAGLAAQGSGESRNALGEERSRDSLKTKRRRKEAKRGQGETGDHSERDESRWKRGSR
jgi:hypothetical protein